MFAFQGDEWTLGEDYPVGNSNTETDYSNEGCRLILRASSLGPLLHPKSKRSTHFVPSQLPIFPPGSLTTNRTPFTAFRDVPIMLMAAVGSEAVSLPELSASAGDRGEDAPHL